MIYAQEVKKQSKTQMKVTISFHDNGIESSRNACSIYRIMFSSKQQLLLHALL